MFSNYYSCVAPVLVNNTVDVVVSVPTVAASINVLIYVAVVIIFIAVLMFLLLFFMLLLLLS